MILIYFILILGVTASLMVLRYGRENRSRYESHEEGTFGVIAFILISTIAFCLMIYEGIK